MGKPGMCALSIVPVRAEPSDRAEITTQLIFGDLFKEVEVSENGKWLKVRNEADGYEGWIDRKQSRNIAENEFERLVKSVKYKTTEPVTTASRDGRENYLIVAGSTLYAEKEEDEIYFGGLRVKGELKNASLKTPDKIIHLASSYLNTPYLWGGKSHFGIDCSGFVQQVYGICGYQLPRDAWQQEEQGEIINIENAKKNDLAFFKNDNGKIIHVGIVHDHNKIIHASGKVRIDLLDEIGIFNEETSEYSHKLKSIKRIIN